MHRVFKYTECHLQDIPAQADGRVKSLNSIDESIERRERNRLAYNKGPFRSLEEIIEDLYDLAGFLIAVGYPSDVDRANQLVKHPVAGRLGQEPHDAP